nr:hypothetical protein [Tanacetum cinerariifolium]
MSAKASDKNQEEIIVVRDSPETLKDELCNAPVLALPDGPEDFVVYCDTSDIGLGCALMQRDESVGLQKGLDEMIEHRSDATLYYLDRIWVPLRGDVRTLIMDEAYNSKYSVHPGADKIYYDLRDRYQWPDVLRLRHYMVERVVHQLCGLRLEKESYADRRKKSLEFSVGDYVLLKVSSWKGVVRFAKKGKITPRFVGPFEIIEKVGPVAYGLDLPEKLNGVHDTARFWRSISDGLPFFFLGAPPPPPPPPPALPIVGKKIIFLGLFVFVFV